MRGIYFVIIAFLMFRCANDFVPANKKAASPNQTPAVSGKAGLFNARIVSYPLNWENINIMPTPANYNGGNVVYPPWGSTATVIDPVLLGDYHKLNGWILVMNTFNTTTSSDYMYFSLYNQYRGIMRIYYFVPSTVQPFNSDHITQALSIESDNGSVSPILSFQNNEIVDWASQPQSVSFVQPRQYSNGTWYVSDWDMAYDPNLASKKFTNEHFLLYLKSYSVTALTINGTQNLSGTIDGQFGASGTNLTVSPSFATNNYGAGSVIYNGGSSDNNSKVIKAIGSTILNDVTSGLSGIASGLVSKLFSGVFGDNNSSPAHITLSGTIQETGDLTNSTSLVGGLKIFIPGTDTTGANGALVPVDGANYPLGLFSLSAKPSVVRQVKVQNGNSFYVYTLQTNSYNFIPNPNLSSVATISNLQQDIILGDANEANSVTLVGGPAELQTLGTRKIWDGSNVIWFQTPYPTNFSTIWVRITFDVVPKNGSGTIHVVKTFKPTVTISNTPYTRPLYQ